MARPQTKEDLIVQNETQYLALTTLLNANPDVLEVPFNFDIAKEKGAHWTRDASVKDVIVHLYEWQNLLLEFIKANQDHPPTPFLPAGYTWKNYAAMNQAFKDKHATTSLIEACECLATTHAALMQSLAMFSNQDLFTKAHYSYVGTSNLASYYISSMSSHYTWAIGKIKKHIRILNAV